MRDYKEKSSRWTFTNRYERIWCTSEPNPFPYGTTTGTYTSHDSARADIVPGNHKSPTRYWAYRRSMVPEGKGAYYHAKASRRYCAVTWKYDYQNILIEGTRKPILHKLQLTDKVGGVRKPIVSSNLKGRASNAVLAKISEKDLDLGQAFGEIIANAGELRALGILGAQLISAFKRRNWARLNYLLFGYLRSNGGVPGRLADNPIANAADWYLMYLFGIRPIMSDAFKASEAMKEKLSTPDEEFIVKAAAVYDKGVDQVSSYTYHGEILSGCEVGVRYKIDNPSLHRLQALGLHNPLQTFWQVAPLSFVVDWFLSIGPFIEGFSSTVGLDYISGYETSFVRTNAKVTWDPGSSYQNKIPMAWRLKEFGMDRVLLEDFPRPAITYRLELGTPQLTTALAMLASSA